VPVYEVLFLCVVGQTEIRVCRWHMCNCWCCSVLMW